MLSEALTALAAAGGTALVQAAGTDAWAAARTRTAQLFGRGQEQRILDELDATRDALAHGGSSGNVAAAWADRFVRRLSDLGDEERSQVADQLGELAALRPTTRVVGQVFNGDVSVRSEHGVAGAVINGSVHVENPRLPGRNEG